MIRVLMITTTPFSPYGIGTVIRNYTTVLKQEAYFDFLVCRGIDEKNKEFVKSIGGETFELRVVRDKHPLQYIIELRRFLLDHNYDVVHIHGNSATMFFDACAAKTAKVKTIIAHSHSDYSDYRLLHILLKPLLNMTVTRGIACSDEAGKWCFYRNYIVINNAINTKKYRYSAQDRLELRSEYEFDENDFVILCVGYVNKGKNHTFIVSRVADLREKGIRAKLMVVGNGELISELEDQASSLGIRDAVRFVGLKQNVEKYYSMADCFAFPSLYEGLGLALIEAQASGLDCIASTGVPRLSNLSGNVHYAPLDNVEDWTSWFINIAKDRKTDDYRKEKSKINSELITLKEFDISVVANSLLKVYTEG